MQCAEIAKKDEIVSLLKRVEVEGIQFLGPCNECEKRRKVVNGVGEKNEREPLPASQEEKKEVDCRECRECRDENNENDERKIDTREDKKENEINQDRECKDEENVEVEKKEDTESGSHAQPSD